MRTRRGSEVLSTVLAIGVLANCTREPGPPTTSPASTHAPTAPRATIASADQALRLLADTVKRDKLYENWRSMECLLFLPDEEDDKGYRVEVREQHGGPCDGDPNFAPIVDRFRVTRDGGILWQDIGENVYRLYEQVRDSIRRPRRH